MICDITHKVRKATAKLVPLFWYYRLLFVAKEKHIYAISRGDHDERDNVQNGKEIFII